MPASRGSQHSPFMTVLEELQAHFQQDRAWEGGDTQAHALHAQQHAILGNFAGWELHSHYQPLLRASDLHVVAHEALLRPRKPGHAHFQSPQQALASATTAQSAVYLDRLCRVVHAMNFVRQGPGTGDLFLNVSAQHLQSVSHSHGSTFESLLELCGLRTEQVVLEILEAGVQDLHQLQRAVQGWRARGFRIAMDDFGCQHSNFDRLWQLTPDIVKLDRQLIQQAQVNPRAAMILPKLIDMIHDLGAQVVCEGVENSAQHALCVEAGTDLLQGYFYARPAAQLHGGSHCDLPMISVSKVEA